MDAGHKSTRAYPGHTTAELKVAVARANIDPAIKTKMETEIAAREAGTSKAFVTPQITGGIPQFKLGRM